MIYLNFGMGLGLLFLTFFLPSIYGRHGWSLALVILLRVLVSFMSGVFLAGGLWEWFRKKSR